MAFLSVARPVFRKRVRRFTCSITLARIAIVGTVSSSFPKALLAAGFEPKDISLQKAITQHATYSHQIAMSPHVTEVYQCPSSYAHPDCVFVEDPVVMVSSQMAFMGRLGHSTRRGESEAMSDVLRRTGTIIRKSTVRVDGGDVLQTPGFVFVGISERTEIAAVRELQHAFDADATSRNRKAPRVTPIIVQGALHLKSVVTWVGDTDINSPGFLVAANTDAGHSIINSIVMSSVVRDAGRTWEVAWITEEQAAANVLFIGGTDDVEGSVFVQQNCCEAVGVVRSKLRKMEMRAKVIGLDTSEFSKANGALTCMSVIV